MRWIGVFLAGAGLWLAGPALAGRDEAVSYLATKSVAEPQAGRVVVCHGFGCAERTVVRLGAGDIAELKRLFAGAGSAPAERAAVARAIALLERKVAPAAGTGHDRGGLDPMTPEKGQLDCIDESTNTTSYLVLLADLGLLKFHVPDGPASRGFLFDLRYPHQTAVMVERASGRPWVVDSWPHPNGQPPDVMPLDQWRNAERRWR
ncbi:hypothetical protein [Blastochloris sulfoviridis]|uniref:Uncharacterized protein n=1 Tax=Blastochloris sulfoviridis TaxID=50712 RepID=A0A5M6HT23_9HYPH|nr:hypothetical protein [Blastochloris sulfoviridis]KAA5598990.1 hypothetical protein F1193_12870 [Blastochloris sulfoviridis]